MEKTSECDWSLIPPVVGNQAETKQTKCSQDDEANPSSHKHGNSSSFQTREMRRQKVGVLNTLNTSKTIQKVGLNTPKTIHKVGLNTPNQKLGLNTPPKTINTPSRRSYPKNSPASIDTSNSFSGLFRNLFSMRSSGRSAFRASLLPLVLASLVLISPCSAGFDHSDDMPHQE